MAKKTLLIDFDGVLSQYDGWKGLEVVGPPIEKARHAMILLAREYRLVCFTTRLAEYAEKWLKANGFPHMFVTNEKLPAHVIIDDRCICFEGEWSDELLSRIRAFRPHWQSDLSVESQMNSDAGQHTDHGDSSTPVSDPELDVSDSL